MEITVIKFEITELIKNITTHLEKRKCQNIIYIKNICNDYQKDDISNTNHQKINDNLLKELEYGFFTNHEYSLIEQLLNSISKLVLALKLRNLAY